MNNPGLTRRDVLIAGAATIASAGQTPTRNAVFAAAVQSDAGTKPTSQLKVSLAAYSFRRYLKGRHNEKPEMTLEELIDLCAVWRLDAIEPTSYYFASTDKPYLHSLKHRAFLLGLDISGTAVGNNFCLPPGEKRDEQIKHVNTWVDHAVEFGAPCIRIFAGSNKGVPDRETAFTWATDCMRRCCDYAGSRGVFLAIENHGYLTESADAVLAIVDAVDHEWFGINLDTGNFHADPYGNMAKAAPKTITCQLKVQVRSEGGGKEPADVPRILQILRDANYRGYVALEYEDVENPKTAVPRHLARLRKLVTS